MIQCRGNLLTLHRKHTTYQYAADENGFLLHTYYGPRAQGDFRGVLRLADRGFSPNPNELGHERTFSLDTLTMGCPASGVGDFRLPMLEGWFDDGSAGVDLRFEGFRVLPGKYMLDGLPAFHGDGAETLSVRMRDAVTGLEAELLYGVFEDYDLITRAVRVRNGGKAALVLTNAASLCLDFPRADFDFITFDGRHTMERIPHRRRVEPGVQMVNSRRGITSHQHNNFVVLCSPDATEEHGSAYGAALVYSGNFRAAVERNNLVELGVFGGEHHNGHGRGLGHGAQTAHDLESVGIGKHDVEEHGIGHAPGDGGLELAVAREPFRLDALLAQRVKRQAPDVVVVLNVVNHRQPRLSCLTYA